MESATKVSCKTCGQVHDLPQLQIGWAAHCSRCKSELSRCTAGSLHLTAAFALAALLLYAPANIFPILRLHLYGLSTENTVWDGCIRLYKDGDLSIAIVVFLASMFIPLLKIIGLFFLVVTCWLKAGRWQVARMRVYKIIDVVGRWAMLDVFVLAVLVSLVKLQRLATIIPGSGALAFTGVVLCTLFASASFDPQLIWEKT